ncbi:hypothetical protein T492DRAFT_866982 [Pavlovales sp. CCMP2436]|nr:hypothetical protein T492DRAFT_866982 [Pavlovales sp. CCMP2436]
MVVVEHMGAFLANAAGLDNIECATVEACCGSGGGVLRWGIEYSLDAVLQFFREI